jgi:hypothetical protein
MPKIQPIVQRVQSPGPVDVPRANPDTMGAGFGRGLEKLGSAVSGVGDLMQKAKEQDEVSELSTKMALAKQDFTLALMDRVKKGEISKNDETGEYTLTDDFKTMMSERLGEIGKNVTTRRAQLQFEQDSAQTQASFTVDAMKAQAQLVGLKSRKEYETAYNARTSRILNSPSSFYDALDENTKDIDNRVATGQIDFATGEELRSKSTKMLAKAYVEGWAKTDNTKLAKQVLESGEVDQYIDSGVKNELYGKIRTEERAARAEENLIKQQEREARKERSEEQMNKLFVDLETGKTGGFRRRVLDNDDLDQRQKEHMLRLAEAKAAKNLKVDPGVYLSLFNRIHADESDPKKIRSDEDLWPYLGRGLDDRKLQFLRKEVAGYNTEAGRNEARLKSDFFKKAQEALVKKDPVFGLPDLEGRDNYLRFVDQFNEAYQEGKAKGLRPSDMLNPDSKDFLGKLITPYVKTSKQRMNSISQSMRPAPSVTPAPTPVPKNDGESWSDYLKRRRGGN